MRQPQYEYIGRLWRAVPQVPVKFPSALSLVRNTLSDFPFSNVLLVEDEPLILLDIEAALLDAGATGVTFSTSCSLAYAALRDQSVDAAIIDMKVSDGSTEDFAQRLRDMGVPFLVYTGSLDVLGPGYRNAPRLSKPALSQEIVSAVKALRTAQSH